MSSCLQRFDSMIQRCLPVIIFVLWVLNPNQLVYYRYLLTMITKDLYLVG